MTNPRRQAAASLAELAEAFTHADLDATDLGAGWHLTETGTLLIQLRPLHPAEITQLATALRTSADRQ
ncbi:hypothetical protein P3T36_002581 [Kitasatospora sp. MAP12-15]|uniref:hypothetical protein n=1 Tax=unclassified Kitasatospora TaxID=2633591 RepID=UPI0024743F2C|nr:hypothetical protein [Kitasatospora sp. MAP12-44]MDH6112863.1 hypothetical protein [Kitasatospora sp. MAP12-44]